MAPLHDDDDPLDTMETHATKLGNILAAYGDTSALPETHPVHALKAEHRKLREFVAEARTRRKEAASDPSDARYNDGTRRVRPNNRDDRFNSSHLELSPDQRVDDAGRIGGPGDARVVKAYETVLEREAELAAAQTGCSIQKGRAIAMTRRVDVMRKLQPVHDPGTHASSGAALAWSEIEHAAETLITKSAEPLTKAKAIDRILKTRLDLVRRYQGIDLLDERGR